MDYKAVYARFIESRRSLLVDGYSELHHVTPRAFGGSDDESNLVRLSPEDHFFAHLLLAKVYGGRMVAALFLMSNRRWCTRPTKQLRSAYGLMRREWALYASTLPGNIGAANGMHRSEVFEWVNIDTIETRHATLQEMHAEFGGNRGMWTQVLNGEKPTSLGWFISTRPPRIRGLKGKVFEFINADGRVFNGTQKDFCDAFGASPASASRICRGGSISTDGWQLVGSVPHPPSKLNKGATYEVSKDGVVFRAKRKEAATKLGISAHLFSAAAHYVQKRNSPYKGWWIKKVT